MTSGDHDLAALAAPLLELNSEQIERFSTYRRLLIEWNAKFNLTAVTDPAEIDRRLFLDALRMVGPIREYASPAPDRAAIVGSDRRIRLVDIGTGAGFPGLALKIALPDLDLTLIEATGKKVRFLEAVIADLRLTGVIALHARAEEVGHLTDYRGAFDVATARGVSSLSALFELSAPLLRRDGVGLFPKGMDLLAEFEAGHRAANLVGVEVESADPIAESETRLVVIRKIADTPRQYPRRPGLPAREPLGSARPPARRPGRPGRSGR